jgi:hypothetical protein
MRIVNLLAVALLGHAAHSEVFAQQAGRNRLPSDVLDVVPPPRWCGGRPAR